MNTKTYIESKKKTENLGEELNYIKTITNKLLFGNNTYNINQLRDIYKNMEILANINKKIELKKEFIDAVQKIKLYLEMAQKKGKFSLENANHVVNILILINNYVDKKKLETIKESDGDSGEESN